MWLPYGAGGCMGAPNGTICLSNGAIWLVFSAHGSQVCTQLPCDPHMMQVACTWCHPPPIHAYGTKTRLSYGTCGSHTANAGSHIPPHSTSGSHMVPSAFHMEHMAPIWCRQLHTVHVALKCTICLLSGTTWLPYGIHGSHMMHTAVVQCTRLY
jgi:hypothetical protein